MLLSRIAESVYWTGRYLERAEATARVVGVYTDLFLDLPKAAGLRWESLGAVTGTTARLLENYPESTEEQVVAFLTTDMVNPGSVMASIAMARENMRVTRTVLPSGAWETLNRLYFSAQATVREAVPRQSRCGWTSEVIAKLHQLAGLLANEMSHDSVEGFITIGRFLERADMTSRVLDVQAETLLKPLPPGLSPYIDLTWMSVLKSVAGEQAYRRYCTGGVQASDVICFLVQDPQFSRSISHCLAQISLRLTSLPHHESTIGMTAQVQEVVANAALTETTGPALRDTVDEVQRALARLHHELSLSYFAPSASISMVEPTPT